MAAFDEPADLISTYESSLDILGMIIGDISEEVFDAGDEWTIAMIINHLLDTEQRYYARARRMVKEDRPRMKIMPDPDYRAIPILTAWTRFHDLRRAHIKFLRSLKKADWRRGGTLDPIGQMTVLTMTRHACAHDAAHMAQIVRRLTGRTS